MSNTESKQLQYEIGDRAYLVTKQKIAELPEKDKKILDSISKVEIGRYDINCKILMMIADIYNNNAIDAFDTIFKLGFIKGKRSMRNKINREDKTNG